MELRSMDHIENESSLPERIPESDHLLPAGHESPSNEQVRVDSPEISHYPVDSSQTLLEHIGKTDATTNLLPLSEKEFPSSELDPEYTAIGKDEQEKLHKDWTYRKQFFHIFIPGLIRWWITVILLCLLGIAMKMYSLREVLDKKDKRIFNAILTGIGILVALNIASALKLMGKNVRWWILARKRRNLDEVNLILDCDSMVSLMKLTWMYRKKALAVFVCISWILINIGAQLGISLIALIPSVEQATDVTLMIPGPVGITNMSYYFTQIGNVPSKSAEEYTANIYGSMALNLPFDKIENAPVSGATYLATPGDLWYDSEHIQYTFLSAPPLSRAKGYMISAAPLVYTNRTINSTYSCDSWPVALPSGNGSFNTIEVVYNMDGDTVPMYIPSVAPESSTFVYESYFCGDRCVNVTVFESSYRSPFYYQCNITVNEVNNAWLPEHKINDHMARVAAGAIGLKGYSSVNSLPPHRTQYQRYPAESFYGTRKAGEVGNTVQSMGWLISLFAIGSIAVADLNNPMANSTGVAPAPGYYLSVGNKKNLFYLYLNFGLVVGIQFLLLVGTTLVANQVIVVDNSSLAIARLLRPTVSYLGPSGTAATGTEISRQLKDFKVMYSVHRNAPDNGKYRQVLGKAFKKERAFPDGMYQ